MSHANCLSQPANEQLDMGEAVRAWHTCDVSIAFMQNKAGQGCCRAKPRSPFH